MQAFIGAVESSRSDSAGIGDPDKIAIGVRPVNNCRQPILAPNRSSRRGMTRTSPSSGAAARGGAASLCSQETSRSFAGYRSR